MNRLTIISVFVVTSIATLINSCNPADTYSEKDLSDLKNMMTGFFSTEAQATEDTSYFHIRLCMQPLWEERTDGYWLYVEQAAYASMLRPYRQRVYHLYLSQGDTALVSKVYEIEDPMLFAGGCSDKSLLNLLTPDLLIERPGCELYLQRVSKERFEGSTLPGSCLSSWRGAAWVSSDVIILPTGLTSWDRGWDEQGELVWGPEEGGYRFDKTNAP